LKSLQLFYTYKFNSSRLKKYNYDINMTINDARRNGELVSIGDNQVLRVIRRLTNSQYSADTLKDLQTQIKFIKKQHSTIENIKLFKQLNSELDNMLHIPEYISVIIDNNSHYKKMINKGLYINGRKYVRMLCGASHSRKNMVMFCAEDIEQELKEILRNGVKDIEIAYSKYNAYFALHSSSTHEVSTPRACVLPDYITKRIELVDWVEEIPTGDTVESKEVELEFNLWDGMGVISPEFARTWANDLGIFDYDISAFAVRPPAFGKGMLCTFDFVRFAELIAKRYNLIDDVWGNPIGDIRNYDVILTESQFKLWKAYNSWDEYVNKCNINGLNWGVSKVTPKIENKYCFTNYQFIQATNFSDEDIESLCQPTIEWFNDILGEDVYKTMLFLNPKSFTWDKFNYKNIGNNIVKALIMNKEVIKDTYIKNKIYQQIRKKVNQSCMGKLLVEGNFQVMISDPYAFCEYIFGMEVKGLLARGEYYSKYWNDNNSPKISAMRAPLTWRSEINTLNLKNNDDVNEWYKYISSGIIYNIHGVDCMIAADSDFDFDIVMTTNSKEFVNKSFGGLPITYQKNPTLKNKLVEKELYISDIYAFNSKIGVVTNHSTSLYAMLDEYEFGSSEYNEIIKRLKICRKEQGSQIDKAKGIIVNDFPKNWIRKQDILDTDTEDVIKKKEFENSLVISKKPYFMRWLYTNLNQEYTKYKHGKNIYCESTFGISIEDLILKDDKTDDEIVFLKEYYKYSPVNESDCIMNKLSRYMEKVKMGIREKSDTFDYACLMSNKHEIDETSSEYKKVFELVRDFMQDKKLFKSKEVMDKSFIKQKYNESVVNNINEFYKFYRNKMYDISIDMQYLADIAIHICYSKNKDKDFVWEVCIGGLLTNLHRSRVIVPIQNDNGSMKYLGDYYSLEEVDIFENIE